MPAAQPVPTASRSPEPDRVSSLVAALDEQRIGDGAGSWVVHVLAVYEDEHDLWMQVSPSADGHDGLVLRLSRRSTANHVIAALNAVPSNRQHYPHVLNVMHTA